MSTNARTTYLELSCLMPQKLSCAEKMVELASVTPVKMWLSRKSKNSTPSANYLRNGFLRTAECGLQTQIWTLLNNIGPVV